MSKQVFLHIGLPKTATSKIQTSLHVNEQALESIGAHYLRSPQHPLFHDRGHHILAVALMEDDWAAMQLQMAECDIHAAWENAVQEIEESPAAACIMSSEWFSFGVHAPAQIDRLKSHLSEFQVHIVLALRDVVGFANSLYAQRVRDGFAGSPTEFIAETWPLLNWTELTKRWAAAFGADNIIAINFDKARESGDPAATFLRHTFGQEVELASGANNFLNQTLPREATELMRVVNASEAEETAKGALRDHVKGFFESSGAAFVPGRYFSDEAELMMRKHCVWPHTVN